MINDNNLSRAWSRLLLGILAGAGTEVSPLVLSVTGFDDKGVVPEDPAVRQAVDQLLKRKGRLKVEDVAFTIFPQRLWDMSRGDRTRLFTPLLKSEWVETAALAGGRREPIHSFVRSKRPSLRPDLPFPWARRWSAVKDGHRPPCSGAKRP